MAPPSMPDKFPTGNVFDETVTITVGENEAARSFTAHKDILCFYSGYFQSALSGHFSEARSGAVDLSTLEPRTFQIFYRWMYRLRPYFRGDELSEDNFTLTLFKLWIFADAHEVPLLQNKVLGLLHEKIMDFWAVDVMEIGYLYENTTPSAKLRDFYIKTLASLGGAKFYLAEEHKRYWPREAALDLLALVWDRDHKYTTKEKFAGWDLCEFHVHEEGVKCPK